MKVAAIIIVTMLALAAGCATSQQNLETLERRVSQNESSIERTDQIARKSGKVAVQNSERLDQIYKKDGQKETGILPHMAGQMARMDGEIEDLEKGVQLAMEGAQKNRKQIGVNRDLIEYGKDTERISILFRTGQVDLEERQMSFLSEICKKVKIETATVVGYADNVGGEEVNERVSQQRAKNVLQAIKSAGYDTKNIKVRAAGSTNRYGLGDSNKQNRRVVIYATPKKTDPS